jgi:lipoyl synthase
MKSKFPSWLHLKVPAGNSVLETRKVIQKHRLSTVCDEAKCPNRLECFSKKTATFLVLGKECTRCCGFCDIDFNKHPALPDPQEPKKIALSVQDLGLKHVVITMVTRDDLPDGGASHLAKIIKAIPPEVTVEVLTSDFNGNRQSYDTILEALPDIFNHNVETVRELSDKIRHKAFYDRSLDLLRYIKGKTLLKSGIMVGLGETKEQVENTIKDLYDVGCDIITIGQYLQPSPKNLIVREFIHPKQFEEYEKYGLGLGVKYMHCGPFVRSSYNADAVKKKVK